MRNRGNLTANARKRRPKTRPKVSALRADPTRSLTLRRGMAVRVKNMFAKLRLELHRLVVDEDELGLKDRHLIRNNCGIGPNGFEVGNDCAKGGGGGVSGDTLVGDQVLKSRKNKSLFPIGHAETHRYHATPKENLKSIKEGGLKPFGFLGREPRVAFGDVSMEHVGHRSIVLRVSKSEKFLEIDPIATEGYRYSKSAVPPDKLEVLTSSGWVKLSDLTTNADAWRFNSDPEKLQKFQEWLRRQLQQFLVGRTQEELWRVYTEQGVKKGAARSFEDARGIEKLKDAGTALAFYAGTKEEFLRSSFRQPESVSKIQLLASRTFTDLKNVTEDMATRMSRTLVDGLTAGQGPRQIAVKLDADLDIGRTRALTIARTEIIRAHAEGQLLALEQLGVQEVGAMVEWSTAGDERVCPLCKPLEGVVLKLDEAKGMLPRHPNCRCAWVPANVGEDQKASKTTKGQITKSVTRSQELEGKTSWGPGQVIAKKRPESILNAAARFDMALNNCGIGPGGFEPGNDCAAGGGGSGGSNNTPNLSEDVERVIRHYGTQVGHQDINHYLRTEEVRTKHSDPPKAMIDSKRNYLNESVSRIDSAMTPLSNDIEVVRVLRGEGPSRHRVGSVITDKAYMSTSTDPNFATKWRYSVADDEAPTGLVLRLKVPAGTKALDISKTSASYGENELLLQRGLSYRVMKIMGNVVEADIIKPQE